MLQITAEAALARRLSSRTVGGFGAPPPSGGAFGGGSFGSSALAMGAGMNIDAESNAAQTRMWQARLQQRNRGTSSGVAPNGFAPAPGGMAPPLLAPHPVPSTSAVGTLMTRADSIDFVSPAIPRSTSLGDMDSRLVEQLGIALQERGKLNEMKRFVQSQQEAGVTKKDRVKRLLTKLVGLLGLEAVVAATNAVVGASNVETMLLKTLKDRLTRAQRSTLERAMPGYNTQSPMDQIKFMQTQLKQAVVVQSLSEVRNKLQYRLHAMLGATMILNTC